MKRQFKFYVLTAIMLMVCAACSAQKMFSEAASIKGVESVYISKALCRMGMSAADLGDVQDGIKELDGLEVISCENPEEFPKLREICEKIIKEQGTELLLSSEEKGERALIYGNADVDENTLSQLFIVSEEKGEFSAVCIKGKFDIKKLMESGQK